MSQLQETSELLNIFPGLAIHASPTPNTDILLHHLEQTYLKHRQALVEFITDIDDIITIDAEDDEALGEDVDAAFHSVEDIDRSIDLLVEKRRKAECVFDVDELSQQIQQAEEAQGQWMQVIREGRARWLGEM